MEIVWVRFLVRDFSPDDFYAMKFVCCRYWFAPVGISLGIKNTKSKKAPPNAVLERAYLSKRKIRHKQVSTLFLHVKNEVHVSQRFCMYMLPNWTLASKLKEVSTLVLHVKNEVHVS